MLGAHPLVIADDAALEDREIAFNRIGMPKAATDVFVDGVDDGSMAAILASLRDEVLTRD